MEYKGDISNIQFNNPSLDYVILKNQYFILSNINIAILQ